MNKIVDLIRQEYLVCGLKSGENYAFRFRLRDGSTIKTVFNNDAIGFIKDEWEVGAYEAIQIIDNLLADAKGD